MHRSEVNLEGTEITEDDNDDTLHSHLKPSGTPIHELYPDPCSSWSLWQRSRPWTPQLLKLITMTQTHSHLKPSGAPIHEPYPGPALHGRYSSIHIFRHHIAAVQEAARHVLAVARVTLHHLVLRLEQFRCDL